MIQADNADLPLQWHFPAPARALNFSDLMPDCGGALQEWKKLTNCKKTLDYNIIFSFLHPLHSTIDLPRFLNDILLFLCMN